MNQTSPKPLREWLVASIVGLVGVQFVVGLGETVYYHPRASEAYASETSLRASTFGAFGAAFHYWASAALLLVTFALLVEMLWNEGYLDIRRWFGAIGSAIVAFVFQITGNLLPMDRHGVQTAVVESGIAGGMPGLGHKVQSLMLSGPGFTGSTLTLWWTAHAYILPFCAIIATWLLVRRAGLPVWIYAVVPGLVILSALIVHAPLGVAATSVDYGQYNARVSWYTWPLHSMLGAFGRLSPRLAWVGSIAIPSLIALGLVLLPWIGKRVTPTVVRGFTLLTAAAFLTVGAFVGGPVAPLSGNRDPAVLAVARNAKPKSTDPGIIALVAQGRQAFNSVGCTQCHGKDGGKGDSGPDLTGEYRFHPDPTWYQGLIRNPKSVNPSATMPPFPNLTNAQVVAISTFLAEPR